MAVKSVLFEENDILSERAAESAKIYARQPKRAGCKVCGNGLTDEVFFCDHGVDYYLCDTCGHLNGAFEDGYAYSEALYTSGVYGGEYREPAVESYNLRLDGIYTPKARFLVDALSDSDPDYRRYGYLDIGAGAGYMVAALRRFGFRVGGIEVDKNQVEYANKMLEAIGVEEKGIAEVTETLENTNHEVITFISTLEHITNLRETFCAIGRNKQIKYIYFNVPLLSLTLAFEIAFPKVWPRQLGAGGGGHTHLFSHESLNWICEHYSFEPVACWHFGTDIMDLYRSVAVTLRENKASGQFVRRIEKLFNENTDAMQQIVDRSGFASEIHTLLKVH
jgi:hypothetical protein